jgi:hypothetical protein
MARLRGLALWLTAVMTMAAGFPQSVCACPRRADTLAESSAIQACPCGGGCCASAETAKCCDRERGPAKPHPRESGQTVCKKALVAAHAQIPSTGNGAGPSRDSCSWDTISPGDSHTIAAIAVVSAIWDQPFHSPPTDLFLLFLHLLI